MEAPGPAPRRILLFSGKRKSGKDYVTDLIHSRLGPDLCCVLRLSAPLKRCFAQERGLDFQQLLGPGSYKELFRAQMIQWGEERRSQDPGFFCRMATQGARQPVWVVSDARRLSDLQWFWAEFPGLTASIRVEASEETRRQRGWSFTTGVDDGESECGLDAGVQFDWIVRNEADPASLDDQVEEILRCVRADLQR